MFRGIKDDDGLAEEVQVNDVALGSHITMRIVCSGGYGQAALTIRAFPLRESEPRISGRHVEYVPQDREALRARWVWRRTFAPEKAGQKEYNERGEKVVKYWSEGHSEELDGAGTSCVGGLEFIPSLTWVA